MACSQPQPGCRFDEISVPLFCGELYLMQRCNWCVDARQQRSGFAVQAPDGPSDQRFLVFRKSNSDLIAMPSEQNLFLGPDRRDGQPDFSASSDEKHWNQWQRQDSYSVAGT